MLDWNSLIGHNQIRDWFANAIASGRLGGSFLFVGNHGVGKTTFAWLLARTLLCESSAASRMAPCGQCEGCVQVAAGTHPDVVAVHKPPDKTFLPLDLLIGPADARMQQGFCRDIRLKPSRGSRKVAILGDADFLNEEGANCLLKTLEEPPADAVILLIGSSEQRQLPTIRSRCQTIRFRSPVGQLGCDFLRQVHHVEADDASIADAIEIAAGDMQVAARLLAGEGNELRDAMTTQLQCEFPDPMALCRVINEHVDKVGKEPSRRRDAMRSLFSVAVQHYRQQLRDEARRQINCPITLVRLDRSLRALREVDRSANRSTLIECYAADIAAGQTGDRGEIGS